MWTRSLGLTAICLTAAFFPGSAFADDELRDGVARLAEQVPALKKTKDRFNQAVEKAGEYIDNARSKAADFRGRVNCSAFDNNAPCTKLFGGKKELTDEELGKLTREQRERYFQQLEGDGLVSSPRPKTWFPTSSSRATNTEDLPRVATLAPPAPPKESTSFDPWPGQRLLEGAVGNCTDMECVYFKIAAQAMGLFGNEPRDLKQATEFCKRAGAKPEMQSRAQACILYYESKFDPRSKLPGEPANDGLTGASALEAMMESQASKDAAQVDLDRLASQQRMEQWDRESAAERQRRQQLAEQTKAAEQTHESSGSNTELLKGVLSAIAAGARGRATAPTTQTPGSTKGCRPTGSATVKWDCWDAIPKGK